MMMVYYFYGVKGWMGNKPFVFALVGIMFFMYWCYKKDGFYEVVIGERRFRASKQAGLDKIPCIIKELNDEEVLEYNLIENVMREDLTEVEKGRCCQRLLKEFHNKFPNIAKLSSHLGVTNRSIEIWIKTANSVTPEIEKYIAPAHPDTKRVPEGKVRSYDVYEITRKVKEPKRQLEAVEKIAEKRLPINELRKVTQEIARQPKKSVDEIFKEYQEKPPEIPFRYSHFKPILDGVKTQTSRKGLDPKIKEGGTIIANIWQPNFAELFVKRIIRKKLKDFNEEDAKHEGGYTLDEFKKVWKNIHGTWNPEEIVNIVQLYKYINNKVGKWIEKLRIRKK